MATFFRTLEEATGITPQEEKEIWARMAESNFRKLVEFEIEKAKFIHSQALAQGKMSHDDYLRAGGHMQGLQQAVGILARADTFRTIPNKK